MSTNENILELDALTEKYIDSILKLMPPGFNLITMESGTEEEKIEKAPLAHYILTISTSVSANVIRAATQLKLIQKSGVGYNNIDTEAAAMAGIPVAISAGANAIAVAEHVFLMVMTLYKNLFKCGEIVRGGDFRPKWSLVDDSYEMYGKTMGIIGLGNVGRQVAMRTKSFGVKTIYYDKYYRPSPAFEKEHELEFLPPEEVIKRADILTLHVPLTEETTKMISAAQLAMMKPSAILINTARGGVVDEASLIAALRDGRIAGAGLDVFEVEPPRVDNPLLHIPNVVVTPHFAAGPRESEERCLRHSFDNIVRFAKGLPLRDMDVVVAPEGLPLEVAPRP